jgi:hypothetical protein
MRRSLVVLVLLTIAAFAPTPVVRAAVTLELPRTIVFSRTDGARGDIYAVKPDGSELAQLTSGPDADGDPAWTADGSAITFTRRGPGFADTWIVDPDGSDAQPFLANARSLVWSPYGDAVAFVRARHGNLDVWTAAADGSDRDRLTTHGARDVQPAWTPDGRLSFVSDRTGRDRIYVMDGDGSGLDRLTFGPGEQRQPSWYSVDEVVYEQDDGNDRDIARLWIPTASVIDEVGGSADDREPDVAMDGELVFQRRQTDGSSTLIHRWIDAGGPGTPLSDPGDVVADRSPAWPPFLAWILAYDDQAKGNLLEAAATAQEIRDTTGSFDDADVVAMHSADPTLDYVDEVTHSKGPEEISIEPDGTAWSAAALSGSGGCYYIRLDDAIGTTYGLEFGAAAASMCSGTDAAGATGAAW